METSLAFDFFDFPSSPRWLSTVGLSTVDCRLSILDSSSLPLHANVTHILRLTAQIAAMLAAIMGKRNDGKITEVSGQDLEKLSLQTIGLPISTPVQMSPKTLRDHLAMSGLNRYHRSVMLAEMLIQEAEMSALGDSTPYALVCYTHAFCLLSDSIDHLSSDEQASCRPKLASLGATLGNHRFDEKS